jgi:quercetin dioxygenase-like cupin family protein
MERERVKDLDPIQDSNYEKMVRYYRKLSEREKSGAVVIRGSELKYEPTRQGFLKYYLSALIDHTAVGTWGVFEHLIKSQSGRHRHQGGIIIYVVEGEGRTETDDVILEWQAGDLLLLPIKPGGSSHQHWNKDTSKGCRWIAFRDLLIARYIANAIDQVSTMPDSQAAQSGQQRGGQTRSEWKATVEDGHVPLVVSPDQLGEVNLFDRLVDMRDLQRRRLEHSTFLIRGAELPWELNAHGRMQWYLHPSIAYSAVQTHIFYRQEIPVGSRSGVQRNPGDVLFYILQGDGYTELNGVRHSWTAGDIMTLPTFEEGVIYRHVNAGSTPVLLVCIERNLVHTTGIDRQSGFEELQPCPEYRQRQA